MHFAYAAVPDQPALVVANTCMMNKAEEAPVRDHNHQLTCTRRPVMDAGTIDLR